MNVVTWVVSAVLAATFLSSGAAKSIMTKERMIATGQTGVKPFSLPVIRIVAASEILGAAGLILPWALGIAPWLTPTAAAGLSIIMVGAAVSHWTLKEYKQVLGVNVVLLILLLLVLLVRLSQL